MSLEAHSSGQQKYGQGMAKGEAGWREPGVSEMEILGAQRP